MELRNNENGFINYNNQRQRLIDRPQAGREEAEYPAFGLYSKRKFYSPGHPERWYYHCVDNC